MEHLNNLFQQAGAGGANNNNNNNTNATPAGANNQPPQQPPRSDFAREAYAAAFQHEMMNAFGLGEQFVASRVAATSQETAEEQKTGPPPMLESALKDLPIVKVTEVDLAKDGNRECCVCLDPQEVSDKATKLPCGHLFHTPCVVQWLRKHGTCPNCRYELPTGDATFEEGRAERMAQRVPRYRLRDLSRLHVRELRQLAARGDRVFAGLTEKSDLVKALVDGGLVQIIPDEVRQLDATRQAVAAWSIRQLKQLMADVGVDSTRCVDKRDLADAVAESGLVAFAAEDDATADDGVS
jgi:E3 ubiquitin-protein ligase RNF115/126